MTVKSWFRRNSTPANLMILEHDSRVSKVKSQPTVYSIPSCRCIQSSRTWCLRGARRLGVVAVGLWMSRLQRFYIPSSRMILIVWDWMTMSIYVFPMHLIGHASIDAFIYYKPVWLESATCAGSATVVARSQRGVSRSCQDQREDIPLWHFPHDWWACKTETQSLQDCVSCSPTSYDSTGACTEQILWQQTCRHALWVLQGQAHSKNIVLDNQAAFVMYMMCAEDKV